MITSFYPIDQIKELGFCSVGKNVLISKFAHFYYPEKMVIGDNVRIDDFCILSGEIKLGNRIHISAYCALYGSSGIELEDYTGLSPRCTVLSASDDFSGNFLIGPMVDEKFTNVSGGKILIKKFSQIGANSIVMPNLTIGEGVVVGAMSLVIKNLEPWGVYVGIPTRFLKPRNKNILKLNFR